MKKAILISILVTVNLLASSQLYVGGSVGSVGARLGGQLFTGWNFNQKWQLGADVNAILFHNPAWIGVHGGPVITINTGSEDDTYLSPYIGLYYKKVGRTSSVDRYIKDGSTVFLATGMETDQLDYGLGLTVTRKMFYAKMGSFFNKNETAFALTIGISHLFR